MELSGVFAIAPTPFTEDGAVDFKSLDRLIDYYEGVGVTGLTILGQMGEAPKLEAEESTQIVERVLGRTRLPVVVGVSAPGFASMRKLAESSLSAGAVAVMIAPPNTLRTDDQIVGYYKNAAAEIGTAAIVVQDYPLTFSVVMSPTVIRRLVEEIPTVAGLKHEDWPGLDKVSVLREYEHAGEMRHLPILCGNGGLFLDFELERGADGAMTGYCYPEMLVSLVRLSRRGARDEAHDVFDAHLPLLRYEQQPGIGLAVRKYVMQRRGLIASSRQRRPGAALSLAGQSEVSYLMRRLEAAGDGAYAQVRS